jgi:hypothetical protein
VKVHETDEGMTEASHEYMESGPLTINSTRESGTRVGRQTEPVGRSSILSEESTMQYKRLQGELSECKTKLKNIEMLYDSVKKTGESLAHLKDDHAIRIREMTNLYNEEMDKLWHDYQKELDKKDIEHEKDCDDLKEEYKRQMKKQDEARTDTITELKSKIGQLEQVKKRLNSEVRRAQEHLLKKSEQSAWLSEPDPAIKDRFTNLSESINRFAKKFAMMGWSPCETRDEQVTLEKYLQPIIRHVIVNDKGNFPSQILDRTANASVLCVGASLAHLLSRRIFQSPFWFLEEALQPNGIYKSFLDGEKRQSSDQALQFC